MPSVGGWTAAAARAAGIWLYHWGMDPAEEHIDPPPLQNHFSALKAMYDTERLYAKIRMAISATDPQAEFFNIENLRSPAYEAVEFHVGHWFPGVLPEAMPIRTDSPMKEPGRKAVEKIWTASNWTSRKQVFARTVGWAGNGFIRIAQRAKDGHPYQRVLEPQWVREFKVDERGFVIYFRYSYPVTRGTGRKKEQKWITEIFSKDEQTLVVYEDKRPVDDPTEHKKATVATTPFASMGIDFVPVVWSPFVEGTPGMGTGVFEPHRDKIHNVNRAATRLDDILFRYQRSVWALETAGITGDNAEIPPPYVEGSFGTSYTNMEEDERIERGFGGVVRHPDGTLTLGSDPFLRLPSGYTLKSLVPTVDMQGALNVVDDHMAQLKRDMPELRYNDALESQARDSAKVLELQLAGATDRVKEARANAEAAMIRAAQMAITIGQRRGRTADGVEAVKPEIRAIFEKAGSFDAGELEFSFEPRPIYQPTPSDKAAEEQAQAQALNEKINVARAMMLSTEPLMDEVARLFGVDKSKLKKDEAALLQQEAAGEGSEGQLDEAGTIMDSILGKGGGGRAPNGGRRNEQSRGQAGSARGQRGRA
jgi:hypothetical protein